MVLELPGPLLLVGAGKMGGALLEGWLTRGLEPGCIFVQDPAPSERARVLITSRSLACSGDVSAALPGPPSVILLAVKPQTIPSTLAALSGCVSGSTLVVSIAAGCTLGSLSAGLPRGAAVVRAMPNTPAAIGLGITACVANSHVTQDQHRACEALLSAVGEVVWIEDELLMDAVTAVSGSGPAYVFLLAECLADAACEAGIEPTLARQLANATVAGAGALLASGADAKVLRENVTSPGGTTAVALSILMGEGGLKPLLEKAVAAATKRSRELGKS